MKTRTVGPLRTRGFTQLRSSTNTVAATVAAILSASAAYAQEATPSVKQDVSSNDTIEEVTVTGIRHAIEASVKQKRDEESIVEVVTQEDIGKLPDPSVAESISRLPGLAGQRANGRVQDIAVRGFSGDYTTTLLNGREQASTGDNRAVEFDQYPGEVVQSVMVYKTTDAERVSEGLAGTIDLRTTRPLTYDKPVFAVGLRGEKNSLGKVNAGSKDAGYRFNATYIGKFDDDKLGLAVGYARLDSPEQERHYALYYLEYDRPPPSGTGAFFPGGGELYGYSRSDVRDGLVGTLEYKPNDRIHSTTDVYYSRYSQRSVDRGWDAFLDVWINSPTVNDGNGGTMPNPGFNPAEPATYLTNPVLVNSQGSSFVTSGDFHGVKGVVLNQYQNTHDKIYAVGENFELTYDKWKAAADLSYSYADRTQEWVETYAGYGKDQAPLDNTVTLTNGLSNPPSLSSAYSYSDAAAMVLGDQEPWGAWGHDGTIHDPESKDEIKSLKLTASRPLPGPFDEIRMGVGYQQRDKSRNVQEYNLFLLNNRAQIAVPSNLLLAPTSVAFGGGGSLLSYDVPGAISALYTISPILDSNHYNKNWTVGEKLTSAFLQFEIKTQWGFVPVSGNLGVQVVHASQFSTGFDQVQGTDPIVVTLVGRGASYTDVLPSLNLKFDLDHGMLMRFSAGKQMVRPRMEDMAGSITASVSFTAPHLWTGNAGNPALEPWRANAFDLTFEKYFQNGGFFAVNGWYKQLTSFIYENVGVNNFDFSSFNSNGITPDTNIGSLSEPVNGHGGVVKGLEAALSLEGKTLSPRLEGFGVQLSMAWTESAIPPDPSTGPTLPGLSPKVRSMTGYYERYGFSARLSERWRSSFNGSVASLFATRVYTVIDEDRQVDASLGYEFKQGPAKGLSIQALVYNLNDSPYRTILKTGGFTVPGVWEDYGRSILIGASYKL
jgi:iron complex outermembrane recepter protein